MVPPPSPPAPYHLSVGGKWIRTIGPPPEIVVDPSGSRRDHGAKYGCLSARPRVRCRCPPGKTRHLLPKSVFDRPGSDRWNLASTTFSDAGPIDAMGRAARDGNFVAACNRWSAADAPAERLEQVPRRPGPK